MTEGIKETLKNAKLHDATLDCVDKNGDVLLIRYRPVNSDESRSLRITGVKTMEALLDRGEIIFDAECHSLTEDGHNCKDPDSISFYSARGDWILEICCSTRGHLILLLSDSSEIRIE